MKQYQVRYVGQYGDSLYDVYNNYDDAVAARAKAMKCAMDNGQNKLASSFYIN